MTKNDEALFEAFLNRHDDRAWWEVIRSLLPSIHEVDRTATEIWFHFFPLALARAFQETDDPAALARDLVLRGTYDLKEQIDRSHRFMYGHRYWPQVKHAVEEHISSANASKSIDLATHIRDVARRVAQKLDVDESLLIGITAVAFMTLQQVGVAAFRAAPGRVTVGRAFARKSPERVVKERARDDRQGLLGFLRGPWRRFTVTFDENDDQATFPLIETQHLTTAAAYDQRDYTSRDPRCIRGEGPIPVQCRSASCGYCWVGILAGAEKLSPVTEFEKNRIRFFGYIETDEPHPLIRLACQAQGFGNVTIVIPPWNGILGSFLRRKRAARVEAHESSGG